MRIEAMDVDFQVSFGKCRDGVIWGESAVFQGVGASPAVPNPASGTPCQPGSASKRSGHGGARPKAATVQDVDGLGDRPATEWENVLES